MHENLALRAILARFMQHLHRAITKKTGAKHDWLAKKIYGEVIAFAHDYPGLLTDLSVAIDKIKNPCAPEELLVLVRCRRDELLSEHKASVARGRAHVSESALVTEEAW